MRPIVLWSVFVMGCATEPGAGGEGQTGLVRAELQGGSGSPSADDAEPAVVAALICDGYHAAATDPLGPEGSLWVAAPGAELEELGRGGLMAEGDSDVEVRGKIRSGPKASGFRGTIGAMTVEGLEGAPLPADHLFDVGFFTLGVGTSGDLGMVVPNWDLPPVGSSRLHFVNLTDTTVDLSGSDGDVATDVAPGEVVETVWEGPWRDVDVFDATGTPIGVVSQLDHALPTDSVIVTCALPGNGTRSVIYEAP